MKRLITILLAATILSGCATTIHTRTVEQGSVKVTESHIYIWNEFVPAVSEPALPHPSNPTIPKAKRNEVVYRR